MATYPSVKEDLVTGEFSLCNMFLKFSLPELGENKRDKRYTWCKQHKIMRLMKMH